MAGAARVSGQAHTGRNASGGAEGRAELVDRGRGGEVGHFLDIDPGVVVALVFLSIGVPFEIDELKPGAICHCPGFLLLVVLRTELGEDLAGPGDYFGKLGEFSPDEDADGAFSVLGGVLEPVPDGGFGLPTSPCPAEENLEHGALEEVGLRAWLRGPEDGLGDFEHSGQFG